MKKTFAFKTFILYQYKYLKIINYKFRLLFLMWRKKEMGMDYYKKFGILRRGYHCFLMLSAIESQWSKGDMLFLHYQEAEQHHSLLYPPCQFMTLTSPSNVPFILHYRASLILYSEKQFCSWRSLSTIFPHLLSWLIYNTAQVMTLLVSSRPNQQTY